MSKEVVMVVKRQSSGTYDWRVDEREIEGDLVTPISSRERLDASLQDVLQTFQAHLVPDACCRLTLHT